MVSYKEENVFILDIASLFKRKSISGTVATRVVQVSKTSFDNFSRKLGNEVGLWVAEGDTTQESV